jgi:hypothetical protein
MPICEGVRTVVIANTFATCRLFAVSAQTPCTEHLTHGRTSWPQRARGRGAELVGRWRGRPSASRYPARRSFRTASRMSAVPDHRSHGEVRTRSGMITRWVMAVIVVMAFLTRLFVEFDFAEIALRINGLAAVTRRSRLPGPAWSVSLEPGEGEDGGDAVLSRL